MIQTTPMQSPIVPMQVEVDRRNEQLQLNPAGKPVFCELQTLTAPGQQVKSDKLQRKWFSG